MTTETTTTRCWCGGQIAWDGVKARCYDSRFHDPAATGEPTQIQTIYVAGPMTGYPDCNYPAFHEAAQALRDVGFTVVNPADGLAEGEGLHYVDFLREDLRAMLDCDAVATLENWWGSVGARNEIQVAGLLKMPIRPVDEWVMRKRAVDKIAGLGVGA